MMIRLLSLFTLALLAIGCSDSTETTSPFGPNPEIGAMAPDFSQTDTSGKLVTLSQFRGKVVLIDFWATWCGPCIREVPRMKRLWSENKGKGLVILSVSLDYNLPNWKAFIAQNGLDWYHVSDGKYWNNVVSRQYGITAIPAMYLIGRDGKVISRGIDGWVISDEAIESALK